MKTSGWDQIPGFTSYGEAEKFADWLAEQIKLGIVKEVPVASRYLDTELMKEQWFSHIESGETWRFVWPDAPFRGVFEPIEIEIKRLREFRNSRK